MNTRLWKLALFSMAFVSIPCGRVHAQNTVPNNAIYVEALGAGFLYSINYERFLSSQLTFRAGLSSFKLSYTGGSTVYVILPLLANVLLGEGRSKFEGGVGVDFFPFEHDKTGTYFDPKLAVIFVASIGYRYQPLERGMQYRLVATPFLSPYTGWARLWFGVSIGYCF